MNTEEKSEDQQLEKFNCTLFIGDTDKDELRKNVDDMLGELVE